MEPFQNWFAEINAPPTECLPSRGWPVLATKHDIVSSDRRASEGGMITCVSSSLLMALVQDGTGSPLWPTVLIIVALKQKQELDIQRLFWKTKKKKKKT